jgi:8-oxo-dGTP pyrophosphatase MutT (NUDIX family)
MSPPQRQESPSPTDVPRQSAVLALLCGSRHVNPCHMEVVFTRRQDSLRHHGGQISFPGGGLEAGDPSLLHTALRETREELGICTGYIKVLGELTPLFIAPSRNYVHPFVGWLPEMPAASPNPAEVAEVLLLPLHELLSPDALGIYHWQRNGQELTTPCYRVGDLIIWGATAMMLSELLTVIRSALHG